jgi:phospholipid/cholesterol/gamma-HCH transport system permease protein
LTRSKIILHKDFRQIRNIINEIKMARKLKEITEENTKKVSEIAIKETALANIFFTNLADVVLFIGRIIKEVFSGSFELKEFLYQCFQIGYKSLPLISITGTIMGLVLTIQSRPVLIRFGAESLLPGMVAVSLIREMGPVITALICAGKIGSGIGAELGSMKVTEQIEAMEVAAIHPLRFLVIPRIFATTLMIPLLILYADGLGVIGSWIGASMKSEVTFVLFVAQAFGRVEFMDFFPAVIKSFFFGAVIGLVGCYKGYNAGRGTESVGIAANSAVVLSSLLVLFIDMIAVQITDMIEIWMK